MAALPIWQRRNNDGMMVAGNTMASSNLPQQLSQVVRITNTARIRAQIKNQLPRNERKRLKVPSRKEKKVKGKGHHDRLIRHDLLYLAQEC